ncbi:MAG: type II toxin-antitoxin system RelE/ParE family toxin [Bacteroidia bacterium]|nr:type II toxin-antitoxin system RelE/ParE family toxin [Bacteroidia bacterium]
MYKVVIERYAEKQLAKIPPPDFNRIAKAISALSENPRPHGYKKLKGRPGYRVRIGNYRVIYAIQDNILTVFVIDIGDRKDIYE